MEVLTAVRTYPITWERQRALSWITITIIWTSWIMLINSEFAQQTVIHDFSTKWIKTTVRKWRCSNEWWVRGTGIQQNLNPKTKPVLFMMKANTILQLCQKGSFLQSAKTVFKKLENHKLHIKIIHHLLKYNLTQETIITFFWGLKSVWGLRYKSILACQQTSTQNLIVLYGNNTLIEL